MKKNMQKCWHICLSLVLLIGQFMPLTHIFAESTIKYNVKMLTETKNPDGTDKLIYLSGENITPRASFDISGDGVNILNAKTVITFPKVKHEGRILTTKPTFVTLDSAKTSEFSEDEDNWYMTYTFSSLRGGSIALSPFPFRFYNDVTPNGTTVTPKYELFDGNGTLLDSASVTYTAQTYGWTSHKSVRQWGWPNRWDDNNSVAVYRQEFRDEKIPENNPIMKPMSVAYALNFFYNPPQGTSQGFGRFVPKTVKIVEHLPAEATLDLNNESNRGWVYNAENHTATFEGSLRLENNEWYSYNRPALRKMIVLRYQDQPLNNEVSQGVRATNVYENTAEFYINPGTPAEERLPDRNAKVKFEAYESVTPPTPPFVKTEHIEYDLWGTQSGDWSNIYEIENNQIVKKNDVNSHTVHFNSRVTAYNNGSDYGNPRNGLMRYISKIGAYDLDNRLDFHIMALNFGSEAVKEKLQATGNKVYGIGSDGHKELLATNIPVGQSVTLPNEAGNYREISVEFDEPILLDNNQEIRLLHETKPKDSELEKFKNREYTTNHQDYMLKMKLSTRRSDLDTIWENDFRGERNKDNNWSRIAYPDPRISIHLTEGTYNVPYQGERNIRRQKVASVLNGTWNGVPKEEDITIISLLPSGIEYAGNPRLLYSVTEKEGFKPEIVENFRNTGKTAVIFKFRSQAQGQSYVALGQVEFDVNVTKYAKQGVNVINHFVAWDRSEIIKPNGQFYKDALDLDGDGDTNETFMASDTYITFLPPEEVLSKKTVALDPSQDWSLSAPAQDLDGDIYYRLSILNNTLIDLKALHVIDVLPYVGDHAIVPNQEGDYLPRESQFHVPLVEAIEDVADINGIKLNERLLERFNVFYSLTPQGTDLASVRDVNWLTKDQVSDFSQVKAFKFVLKEGSIVTAKEEVSFITHNKIPKETALDNFSVANNTTAFSRNGVDYIEANRASVSNVKYTVDGIVFADVNKDGDHSDDEPLLAGYTAQLMHEDGTPVKGLDGELISAVTDAKGHYEMNVYKRGKYYVQFTKKYEEEAFTPISHTLVGTSGNDTTQSTDNPNIGTTPVFELSPPTEVTRHGRRNAGIIVTKGDIFVVKTNENGDKLKNVGFQLFKENQAVSEIKKTDEQGEVSFTSLDFGTYELREVEGLDPYRTIKPITITLSSDHVQSHNMIENIFKKGSIKLIKQDADTKQPLAGVEFTLKKANDDTVVTVKTTTVNGELVFDNVPYGDYKVVETNTLASHNLDSTEYNVTIREDEKEVILTTNPIYNTIKKGSILVKKVDAEQDTKVLEGAVFGLFKDQETQASYKATTNSEGIATFKGIPYGTYTLKEITAPTGYLKTEDTQEVVIDTNEQVIEKTVRNTVKKADVVLTKTDADTNSPLEGVTFELRQGDKVVGTSKTTDAKGKVRFEQIPYGDYTLVETQTLENYVLDSTPIEVQVRENGVTIDKTMTNVKKKADIVLTKTDADTKEVLAGVTFELRQGDTVIGTPKVTDETGRVRFEHIPYGNYTLVETRTLENYVLNSTPIEVQVRENGETIEKAMTNVKKKSDIVLTKTDEDTKEVLAGVTFELRQGDKVIDTSKTTDDKGKVRFEHIPYGDYTLVETQTLENYVLDSTPISVSVREDGATINKTMSNVKKKGRVIIRKVDADHADKTIEGVTFVLKQNDQEKYQATSDAKGIVTFDHVVYGDYILEEKETLKQYNLSVEKRTIQIRENGKDILETDFTNTLKKGTVIVKKADKDDPTKVLQGVTFHLLQNGEKVYEATTDASGQAIFEKVVYGTYIIQEASTLTNYNVLEGTLETVTIDTEGQTIIANNGQPFLNEQKKSNIVLTKTDADTKEPLAGVTFALKQGDKVVDTQMTNQSGQVRFERIPYGDYTLVETATLENYVLNSTPIEVQVRENGKTIEKAMTNVKKKSDIVLTKTDVDTKEAITGVTFALKQGDIVIDRQSTNDKGQVRFKQIPYGDYTLVETQTLENYVLDSTPIEVQVRENGETIEKAMTNVKKKSNIVLTKTDADTKEVLAGVTFELRQGDTVIGTPKVTDEKGQVQFEHIPYGDYTLVETATLENYVLDSTPIEVQVRENGVTIEKTMTNVKKKSNIVLTKTDADTKEVLAGVKFELRQGDQVVDTQMTNQSGQVQFKQIPYGDYTLVETITLENYVLDSTPILVSVRENGVTIDKVMTNVKKKADVVLTKADADNPEKKLEGVTFALYQHDKKVLEAKTDSTGQIIFKDVVYGTYQLKEIATLENYNLLTDVIDVTVTQDKQTVYVNEQKPILNTLKKGTIVITKKDAFTQKALKDVVFELHQGDKVIDTQMTDDNGQIIFKDVVYGDYTLVETKPLPGYQKQEKTVLIQVRENGEVIEKDIFNRRQVFLPKETKTESTTQTSKKTLAKSTPILPKTGETISMMILWIGAILVGSAVYLKKNNK
ncbi:LPXTG cell wall anchor domain-containing protein [Granulicatella sp. zg-ZJ]|uniref:SpaA isopeptide-forming pilin-related protein n=1 Tax=Granulicatella sp. zg-ZJ TaxID=2678504 RepID=UPI0013D5FEBF|nr:SpaA isopeptide-forming pilin-related protein [Granulicatella sp. zg-ZJ]NEW63359.1 LPXTG cell wall anchor domain-containing protein [Granulicatella sp. zg-ZJ]